jgi:hypothetical protein
MTAARPLLAAILACAVALSGCTGTHVTVRVVVVASDFSGGAVSLEAWDSGNHQVLDAHAFVAGNGMTNLPAIEAKEGAFTLRGSANNTTRLQEDVELSATTPVLYMLVHDGGVQFSLDGSTPL